MRVLRSLCSAVLLGACLFVRPPGPVCAQPSAFGPLGAPAPGEPERYARTPDPSRWQQFAMPGARLVAAGDVAVSVGSLLGWAALRYGAHRRVDVGVGVPFALVGLSADARVLVFEDDRFALSLWAMAQVPMHPGTAVASDFFSFTWAGGGPWIAAGPVASLSGDRGAVTLGVHGGQRLAMGGLWLLAHLTVDVRLVDGLKLVTQAALLGEAALEVASPLGRRSLLGNAQPRWMPYATLGVRLFTRKSSVDLGALVIVGERSLLAYGPVSVWPWLNATHTF
jgi:hypothetical protein